jgi:hypothetical protein
MQTNVNFQNDLNDYLFVDIIIKPKDFLKTASSASTSRKNSINNNLIAASTGTVINLNQNDSSKLSQNKSLTIDLNASSSNTNNYNTNSASVNISNNCSTHFNYFYEKIDQENYFNIILKTNSTQQLNQGKNIFTEIGEKYFFNKVHRNFSL